MIVFWNIKIIFILILFVYLFLILFSLSILFSWCCCIINFQNEIIKELEQIPSPQVSEYFCNSILSNMILLTNRFYQIMSVMLKNYLPIEHHNFIAYPELNRSDFYVLNDLSNFFLLCSPLFFVLLFVAKWYFDNYIHLTID